MSYPIKNWFSGILKYLFPFLLLTSIGCKKLVEVPGPINQISSANVFSTDATAAAVLTGVYTNMSSANAGWQGLDCMFLYPALSSDELTLYDIHNTLYLYHYFNALNKIQTGGVDYWLTIYPVIGQLNQAIEGLTTANSLTPAVKQQLMGEALFMRAYCYFYLVNFYGDVPLVTNTNYKTNSVLSRTPKTLVWLQIIADLKNAQNLLSANYLDATVLKVTAERVRPTKWVAAALLARAYLYNNDYLNAEKQASIVIGNLTLYDLEPLNNVFLKNNNEAIWQLQPVNTGQFSNTGEGALFVLPSTGPDVTLTHPVYLSSFVLNSFEPGDQRRVNWVDSVIVGGTAYYFPYKYKQGLTVTSTTEYSTLLRLGEQYLIRAEARAEQGDISGAQADLNSIRARAGLPNTAAATKSALLTVILHERQVELFTEGGHRWLDLKRTGTVDAVMKVVTPQKGGTWSTNSQWYPIPLSELQSDPNLAQNTGY